MNCNIKNKEVRCRGLAVRDCGLVVRPAWNIQEGKDKELVYKYLESNRHPVFRNKDGEVRDLTSMLSSIDLAHAMNFPRKSLPGLPVVECAEFGRNISILDTETEEKLSKVIHVGKIWHMHREDGGDVVFDIKMLTSHVFITGSTGAGKSNAVYQLLNLLNDSGKKFLVIEPTKGEYKTVFGGRDDVTVLGTNPKRSKLLRINPFSFPEDVQLYAHIDRLIEIFNACWPMYAAMPAILKDAIERAYLEAGWDLQTSENEKYGRLFPTFIDVLHQIDCVLNESDYSGESKGDYKGALKTRLKSLTNGIFGMVFASDEISEEKLFDENVIVDLSEIGSETTSLIMGMLVLKLQEYRMKTASKDGNIDVDLNHVTVLEEAHNLLRRTSIEQSAEGSNLLGKSVEMITNAIAEMRTYGESFFIVDQAPGLLDASAIRNTNTKIILRLPDYSDRELAGKSIGLNDSQIVEIGKLERGVAAVYQSGWTESVLCAFEKFKDKKPLKGSMDDVIELPQYATIILNAVLYGTQLRELISALKGIRDAIVYKSSVPISIKKVVWRLCEADEQVDKEQLAVLAYELMDADVIFKADKKPVELDFMKQFKNIAQTYHMKETSISKENLSIIISLLNDEHERRLNDCMYDTLIGGVL